MYIKSLNEPNSPLWSFLNETYLCTIWHTTYCTLYTSSKALNVSVRYLSSPCKWKWRSGVESVLTSSVCVCLCRTVAYAQNHPDPHPYIQVICPSFPQQRGGPQPGDRTHHHPGHPWEGRDHRCEFDLLNVLRWSNYHSRVLRVQMSPLAGD